MLGFFNFLTKAIQTWIPLLWWLSSIIFDKFRHLWHQIYNIQSINKYEILYNTILLLIRCIYLIIFSLWQKIHSYHQNWQLWDFDPHTNGVCITTHTFCRTMPSGNALVSIIEVTQRRARLILGWVTVCGQVNHLGKNTTHSTQPSTLRGTIRSVSAFELSSNKKATIGVDWTSGLFS